MSNYKNGTEEILYLDVSGTYYPIGCLTGNGFNEGVDMLETTTRENSDGWKTSIPTQQSYNIPFDGVVTTSDISGTVITYEDLMDLKRAKTKVAWKINSEMTGYSDVGYGYIRSLSKNAETDTFISFSAEIVGYGQPSRILDTGVYLNFTLNQTI